MFETDSCQDAFDTLKKALTEAPILDYPDFNLPFLLATDASNDAIGMVLGRHFLCWTETKSCRA